MRAALKVVASATIRSQHHLRRLLPRLIARRSQVSVPGRSLAPRFALRCPQPALTRAYLGSTVLFLARTTSHVSPHTSTAMWARQRRNPKFHPTRPLLPPWHPQHHSFAPPQAQQSDRMLGNILGGASEPSERRMRPYDAIVRGSQEKCVRSVGAQRVCDCSRAERAAVLPGVGRHIEGSPHRARSGHGRDSTASRRHVAHS